MGLEFKFCGFDEDVVKKSYDLAEYDRILYILPTASNKKALIKTHQYRKSNKKIDFMTWHEFKDFIILPEKRIADDLQQAWFLYKSFSENNLAFFGIDSFRDLTVFAENFNNFRSEISEENIGFCDLELEESDNVTSILRLDWQIKTADILGKVLKKYYGFLDENNFTDLQEVHYDIFSGKLPLNSCFLSFYDEIIIVNQFQFSKLDKFIVSEMKENNEKVTLLLQMPEIWYDKERMMMKDKTDLATVKSFKTKNINFKTGKGELEIWNSFASESDKFKAAAIIDNSFKNSFISGFLNEKKVRIKNTEPAEAGLIYNILFCFSELLRSTATVNDKLVFEMNSILSVLNNSSFIKYYFDNDVSELEPYFVDKIYHEQIIYFEEDNCPDDTESWKKLKEILLFVKKMRYFSVEEFLEFIINILMNEEAESDSEEKNTILTLLNDFRDSVRFMPGFDKSKFGRGYRFIDVFLKLTGETAIYRKTDKIDKDFMITHLDDVRNRSFDVPVFIMNANENVLPSSPKPQFLLNETQRKQLGLATYEDKRKRERYYFFRLILNSKNVNIYAVEDIEKNIFAGSFFEEALMWAKSENLAAESEQTEELPDNHYSKWWKAIAGVSPKCRFSEKEDLVIPFEKPNDKKIPFTFYSFKEILKDPIAYYLQYRVRMKVQPEEADNSLNIRKTGIIFHETMNFFWKKVNRLKSGTLRNLIENGIVEQWAKEGVNFVIEKNKKTCFSIPLNYSKKYFDKIFLPFMIAGIKEFLKQLADGFLSGDLSEYEIIPEAEFITAEEKKGFAISLDNTDLKAVFSGKADLILKKNNFLYVIDYKVSNSDKFNDKIMNRQLVIYKELYKKESSETDSSFYFLMDRTFKSENTFDRETLKDDLNKILPDIAENGYRVPEKNSAKNIYWSDLY
ncbi:MAG: hypothetical protein CSB55_05405 [Candidatus Cloacimonadota bacterium]|nr:MAG: hypothetical protein CSB55_05405 [Candidatus Cloacimonadota bacterium]